MRVEVDGAVSGTEHFFWPATYYLTRAFRGGVILKVSRGEGGYLRERIEVFDLFQHHLRLAHRSLSLCRFFETRLVAILWFILSDIEVAHNIRGLTRKCCL